MNNNYKFGMLGKKVGMTQIFDENRNVVPVTVVEVGPCPVLQKKTVESDGYFAIQIGFDDKKKQRVNKPEVGHVKAAGSPVKRIVREVRLTEKEAVNYEVGQLLTADLFQVGDKIDAIGTSIGKGYQGVVRRHNFKTPDMTHNHEHFRHGGSIGCREWPGRVMKGRKMPGQMGNERVTVQNLTVAAVEADKNYVLIKGAVPGAKNSYVYLQAASKIMFKPREFSRAEATQAEAEATAAT